MSNDRFMFDRKSLGRFLGYKPEIFDAWMDTGAMITLDERHPLAGFRPIEVTGLKVAVWCFDTVPNVKPDFAWRIKQASENVIWDALYRQSRAFLTVAPPGPWSPLPGLPRIYPTEIWPSSEGEFPIGVPEEEQDHTIVFDLSALHDEITRSLVGSVKIGPNITEFTVVQGRQVRIPNTRPMIGQMPVILNANGAKKK